MQLQKTSPLPESTGRCSDTAAQAAANQADALLDSIQMPCIHTSAVIIDASSSEGSGDDESDAEQGVKAKTGAPNMGKESVSS